MVMLWQKYKQRVQYKLIKSLKISCLKIDEIQLMHSYCIHITPFIHNEGRFKKYDSYDIIHYSKNKSVQK